MDETHNQISEKNRASEAGKRTAAQRLGLVLVQGGSFERELPLMQRQGPATLEGATNRPNHCSVGKPPFTQWIALILFQSKKLEMEEKERGLY